ncbi:MAG: (Fe-S)-binding protein [Nitrososphaerota archaeon]|jgi:Fe-S oxidoreductase|nr:(Fe-S)-binding protein [Nitrososphaerota archaeon]MDG6942040.1 (Fe-S)-binding protein [Nitrososphaerota archaeon]MDG6942505.1 (Fe-S)-binding protein [Nitrososphaerota archaeon]MDG6948292.1 (Fe-S)-binding protein [Nitrososphaerota archaeon]
MAGLDVGYLAAYAISFASVAAVAFAVVYFSRRWSVSLGPARIWGLGRDEARRLKTGDPVFLMHLSIALGVGLTIADAVLAPAMGMAPLLLAAFRVASVPLAAGLAVAFGWRVQRYFQSRRVGREVHVTEGFASASKTLQIVLMAAIALTTSELVLLWFPALGWADLLLDAARNSLVAGYYARPSINLFAKFDRPLASLRTPFNLADVMAGKTDPEAIKVGVGKVSDFTADQSLSFDSCVEIGACEAACPATAAGRPLSPRVLVRKVSLLSRAGRESDPFTSVAEDELWSCTSCGACVASCPVGVKHLDVIYDLRRELVSKGKLDKEKSGMLANLAQSQNPYGFKNSTRAGWAEGLGIDTLAANPKAEYLYWVGCVSSFDQRAQRIAKALAKILKSAGVSFAILGGEEMCVGDPARRLGEEGRYQELALQNIEKLNSYGVKKIIATCPHCFNALKNEYPQFGAKFDVVYHTQLISDLIRDGKVSVPREKVQNISVTLHDACYASRYNSVFDQPREALAASVHDLREMGRRKEKTFCCGAGGSNYWFNVPHRRSIAGIRAEEAARTGAKTIATECPFCLSMFDDATKVTNSGMDVRDVAEIVAECI